MIRINISLKKYNSFNIDVNAKEFVEVNSTDELIEIANRTKDKNVLYLGGGSNILFTRDFDGIVIHLNIKGVQFEKTNSDETVVEANAGENWNNFVEFCIKNNLGGIENLSMIPGNVGSAPVQNIGAYGVELKDVFLTCEVFNKNDFSIKTYNLEDCKFEYRNSIFKENKSLIILSLRLKLKNKNHKKKVRTTSRPLTLALPPTSARRTRRRGRPQASTEGCRSGGRGYRTVSR